MTTGAARAEVTPLRGEGAGAGLAPLSEVRAERFVPLSRTMLYDQQLSATALAVYLVIARHRDYGRAPRSVEMSRLTITRAIGRRDRSVVTFWGTRGPRPPSVTS